MEERVMNLENSPGEKIEKQSEERTKLTKVVSGKAEKKEPSELKKLWNTFVVGDPEMVRKYILKNVIEPAIRNTLWDTITKGLRLFLFNNEDEERPIGKTSIPARSIDFTRFAKMPMPEPEPLYEKPIKHSYEGLVYETKADAACVLAGLKDRIAYCQSTSVGDLYELSGREDLIDFTDYKFGWRDLSNAYVQEGRSGYYLKLPKPRPLS